VNGCIAAYKNRSFLRRLLREKSCQIAALGSRYVPICARIAYRFHLCIARRSNAPLSHFSPRKKSPSHEYYVRMPRLSAHGINFSNESWGHLRGLAYQVAHNSRVLTDNRRPWHGGISSERGVRGAKVVRLSVYHHRLSPSSVHHRLIATGILPLFRMFINLDFLKNYKLSEMIKF